MLLWSLVVWPTIHSLGLCQLWMLSTSFNMCKKSLHKCFNNISLVFSNICHMLVHTNCLCCLSLLWSTVGVHQLRFRLDYKFITFMPLMKQSVSLHSLKQIMISVLSSSLAEHFQGCVWQWFQLQPVWSTTISDMVECVFKYSSDIVRHTSTLIGILYSIFCINFLG